MQVKIVYLNLKNKVKCWDYKFRLLIMIENWVIFSLCLFDTKSDYLVILVIKTFVYIKYNIQKHNQKWLWHFVRNAGEKKYINGICLKQ